MKVERWLPWIVGGLMLLVAVGIGQAQQRGPTGAGRIVFTSSFWDGDLLDLVALDQVQKEIGLTDEQRRKVLELAASLREQRGQGSGQPKSRNLTDEELWQAMQRMREEKARRAAIARTGLRRILLPQQMERLEQLNIQLLGWRALFDPVVQAKLKLTDDQKAKLQAMDQDSEPQPFVVRRIEKEDVLGVLTARQRQEFESLKGRPFNFNLPQPPRFGR
ncbi:MAG: hypothetical protein KatS3mg110_0445 [Pirellulaceae bacterium]|nr:MAG: hypothetical protein KatS3mg110_0445 [Pirellulaceae bacterium]